MTLLKYVGGRRIVLPIAGRRISDTSVADGVVSPTIEAFVLGEYFLSDPEDRVGVVATSHDNTGVTSGQIQFSGPIVVTQGENSVVASGNVSIGVSGSVVAAQSDQLINAVAVLAYLASVSTSQELATAAVGSVGYIGAIADAQSEQGSNTVGEITFSGSMESSQAENTHVASGLLHYIVVGSSAQPEQTMLATGGPVFVGTAETLQDESGGAGIGVVQIYFTGESSSIQSSSSTSALAEVQQMVFGDIVTTQGVQTQNCEGVYTPATLFGKILINGVWRTCELAYICVNGEWKVVAEMFIAADAVWHRIEP